MTYINKRWLLDKHVTKCVDIKLIAEGFCHIFTSATDTCLEAKNPPHKNPNESNAMLLFFYFVNI